MSPLLRTALEDSLEALKAGNLNLAYQLSACKSFIVGVIDPEDSKNAFQEDQDANEKLLRDSIYHLVDVIHHELAWKLDQLPSGAALMSSQGMTTMHPSGAHHVIIRMNDERAAIMEKLYPKPSTKRKVKWQRKNSPRTV